MARTTAAARDNPGASVNSCVFLRKSVRKTSYAFVCARDEKFYGAALSAIDGGTNNQQDCGEAVFADAAIQSLRTGLRG
jgi:hypothetical protein